GERFPSFMFSGRDAFFKLLAVNGLLVRRRRSNRPVTTLSRHHSHKFGNLWKGRYPGRSQSGLGG
ncbi:MAG: hypothetical protein LBB62_03470, partial [Proteiniphilum sp.]|nr:hypothetical protein [Proteiniphilum sp.]